MTIYGEVRAWAEGLGLDDPAAQLRKFKQEVKEFLKAVEENDRLGAPLEAADVVITLINYMRAAKYPPLEESLEFKARVVMARTGRVVNGEFVKDAP